MLSVFVLDKRAELGYSVAMAEKKKEQNLYPELILKNNDNPSKLLAFPLLGLLIRTILLFPVFIEGFFLALGYLFFWISVPFVILFKGTYWDRAYDFFLGYFKFKTKVSLYLYGLTDKYPWFGLDDNGLFSLRVTKPVKPGKLLGFPLLGFIIRSVLLIPYIIFASILSYGALVAVFVAWFAVLFTGKYPESLYGFVRDSIRVDLADEVYCSYLSDTYPSFYMGMKNKTVRNLLIIAGALFLLLRIITSVLNVDYDDQTANDHNYNEQIEYNDRDK